MLKEEIGNKPERV